MVEHMRSHIQKFGCRHCGAEYITGSGRKRHETLFHDQNNPRGDDSVPCPWCKLMCENRAEKNTHLRTCSSKPLYISLKSCPPFAIIEDTTSVDFWVPGLNYDVGHRMIRFRAWTDRVINGYVPEPVDELEPVDYSRVFRDGDGYIFHRISIAIYDPAARRTTRVVTGPFTRGQMIWLSGKGRFTKRRFRRNMRASAEVQVKKSVKGAYNDWVRQFLREPRRMRLTVNGNINMFHPDAVVWGHTLEHALGGSSEFTSVTYHGWRANKQEISAIEYFGRRYWSLMVDFKRLILSMETLQGTKSETSWKILQ